MSRPLREASMNTTTTVPVTVTPEAAEHVAKLGLRAQLEQMIAHAQQTIPKLHRIEVTLEPPYEAGVDEQVVIWAHKEFCGPDYDPAEDQFSRWVVRTFPPDVFRHLVLLTPFVE
jgi:hypothetical protein